MGTIDSQMKLNADNASGALSAAQSAQTNANSALTTAQGADTKADTALTNAGTAQSTADNATSVATSALSTANTANTNAQNAQTTANTANTNASTAIDGVNDLQEKFNLKNIISYGVNDIIKDSGTISGSSLKLAYNDDASIFKLYGSISGTNTQSATIQTPLRPETEFTINPAGINNSGNVPLSATIKTNGEIVLNCGWGSTNIRNTYFPCVYFNTNFGDEPIIPSE
jgi:hypothetical protein